MVAAFDPGTVDDGAIRRVVDEHLALENPAILEREMEYVSLRRVRHGIKPYDGRRFLEALKGVTHTSEIAMPTMQTPYAPKRLSRRQLLHTSHTPMQRVHLVNSIALVIVGLCTRPVSAQTFQATVQQVAIPVTVQSAQGGPPADLRADDFSVFDDGRVTPIVTFGKFRQPLHILLLLDTSRSVMNSLPEVSAAAQAVLAQLAPDDSVRVGTFSDVLRLSPPLSPADRDLAGRLAFVTGANTTVLFDALMEGCTAFSSEMARRVIVVISDGADTASAASAKDVMRRAAETNVAIYAVGVSSRYIQRGTSIVRAPDSTLRNIAEDTGGRYVFTGAGRDFTSVFAALIEELRQQYILGFTPANADGRLHSLVVTTRQPHIKVRARKHYLARLP
jgi:Ca-activated chloride channel family protein